MRFILMQFFFHYITLHYITLHYITLPEASRVIGTSFKVALLVKVFLLRLLSFLNST